MTQCIAALFTPAWTLLQVLGASFASPRGRHAARRRRSRRVRPYAPALPATPAPSPLPAHPTTQAPKPTPRRKPLTRTSKLAPPSTESRAEDIALVRPYLTAHEERDLAQQRATDRLRAWGAEPPPVTTPQPQTQTRSPVRDWGTNFPAPQPRIPAPRVPSRLEELPHLSRLRHRQQQRRTKVAAI